MTAHGNTRRGFLSGLIRGAAAGAVAVVGVGCVDSGTDVRGDDATEVLPRQPGLWYANMMPAYAPAVRGSAPVAPDWSTSKSAA